MPLTDDPDFVAFCRVWEAEGRAPLPFADYLRDRGEDAFADAVAWAATQTRGSIAHDVTVGLYPRKRYWRVGTDVEWYWIRAVNGIVANAVPPDVFDAAHAGSYGPTGGVDFTKDIISPTFADAVAVFLLGWKAARGGVAV